MTGKEIVTKANSYLGKTGSQFCKEYGLNIIVDWCVIFVWYVFRKCNASLLLNGGQKIANCRAIDAWGRKECKFISKVQDAKPGDIILMQWDGKGNFKRDGLSDHCGIVASVKGNSYVNTIEGNTGSDNNQKSKVYQKVRYPSVIYAIYRPKYTEEKKTTEKKTEQTSNADLQQKVKDVLLGKYGNGATRKKKLGKDYDKVQDELNRLLKLVNDTLAGKYGNGATRKKKLGKDYEFVQWYINGKK